MLKIRVQENEILTEFTGCHDLTDVRYVSASSSKLIECNIAKYFPLAEIVDVSLNELDTISGPTSLSLKSLDCSHNKISDLSFLQKFPSLIHLRLIGNPLTADDYFLAVGLCRNLKTVNNKSVRAIHSKIKSYEEKIWPLVTNIWRKNFEFHYSALMSTIEFAELRQEFETYLDEKNIFEEARHSKFLKQLIIDLVTKLMISVRQNAFMQKKADIGSPCHYFLSEVADEILTMEMNSENTFPVLNALPKNTVRLCIDDAPRDNNESTRASALINHGGETFDEKKWVQTRAEHLASPDKSKSLRIRIKRLPNDNPKEVNHLISEILTSPQKLTVKLTRLENLPDDSLLLKDIKSPIAKSSPLRCHSASKTQSPYSLRKSSVFSESEKNDSDDVVQRSPLKILKTDLQVKMPLHQTRSSAKKESPRKSARKEEVSISARKSSLRTRDALSKSVKRKLDWDHDENDDVQESQLRKMKVDRKLSFDGAVASDADDVKNGDVKKGNKDVEETNDDSGSKDMRDEYWNFPNATGLEKSTSVASKIVKKLPELEPWKPLRFFRCHGNPSDETLQIWSCAFEPNAENPDTTTSIAATCGGQTVCFIDCAAKRTTFRYKCDDPKEDFFVLDWTILTMDTNVESKASVLATAGRSGIIHLILYNQLLCYSEIKAHKNISALKFHPMEPTILCSGGAKGKIVLWDIGTPTIPDYKTSWSQLQVIQAPCDVLKTIFSVRHSLLIAGCETGCYAWKVTKHQGYKMQNSMIKFLHPPKHQVDGNEPIVDSIALITDDVLATKCSGFGYIYLWNLKTTLLNKKTKHRTYSLDMIAALTWSPFETFFLNFGISAGNGILACGDNRGQLWMYNIKQLLTEKSKKPKNHPWAPSAIIAWPECKFQASEQKSDWNEVIVNSVSLSSDGRFVIAVTDKNLVCFWAR